MNAEKAQGDEHHVSLLFNESYPGLEAYKDIASSQLAQVAGKAERNSF